MQSALQLARLISKAAEIREASFKPWDGPHPIVTGTYSKTCGQATDEACAAEEDKVWAPIVSVLITTCWNDSLEWAEQIIKESDNV